MYHYDREILVLSFPVISFVILIFVFLRFEIKSGFPFYWLTLYIRYFIYYIFWQFGIFSYFLGSFVITNCKCTVNLPLQFGAGAPRIFQIAIFGQKTYIMRAKPLDFRASNGENIRATDLSPLNDTGPVCLWIEFNNKRYLTIRYLVNGCPIVKCGLFGCHLHLYIPSPKGTLRSLNFESICRPRKIFLLTGRPIVLFLYKRCSFVSYLSLSASRDGERITWTLPRRSCRASAFLVISGDEMKGEWMDCRRADDSWEGLSAGSDPSIDRHFLRFCSFIDWVDERRIELSEELRALVARSLCVGDFFSCSIMFK